MSSQRQVIQWLTAGAVAAALACVVGVNARAVYAACTTGCHLGEQLKIQASAWEFSRTNARQSWYTTGTTGGTYTTQGTCTSTLYSYYTAECPDKTNSWCSALSSPTTTTITSTLAYCAGS
jgi:hypothetical protein